MLILIQPLNALISSPIHYHLLYHLPCGHRHEPVVLIEPRGSEPQQFNAPKCNSGLWPFLFLVSLFPPHAHEVLLIESGCLNHSGSKPVTFIHVLVRHSNVQLNVPSGL